MRTFSKLGAAAICFLAACLPPPAQNGWSQPTYQQPGWQQGSSAYDANRYEQNGDGGGDYSSTGGYDGPGDDGSGGYNTDDGSGGYNTDDGSYGAGDDGSGGYGSGNTSGWAVCTARGGGYIAHGSGLSREDASAKAIQSCRAMGGGSCSISECMTGQGQ